MKPFQNISVEEMLDLMKDGSAMILDCRDMKDYKESHVEDAMHVHEGLRDALIKNADKNRKMLIYCYYGHASEHLAEMFADFGFKQLFSLDGGYASWKEYHKQQPAS